MAARVARNMAVVLSPGVVRAAKHDALLDAARAYVGRLESAKDPEAALKALGAAAVEWRIAERAMPKRLRPVIGNVDTVEPSEG